MKKKGIILSILLFICILVISLLFLVLGNKENLKYNDKIISNNYEYEQSITNESIEDVYYYSDSYFKENSSLENEHLRTFAFSLALAFNPTNRKDEVNYNLNKIYGELEFSDIEYYDLEDFSKDTIGTSIAHKKLNEKYELVVIVLRGAGYKDEWKSNFDLGSNGNAKGFDESSMIVLNRLKEYIKENKIENYKLLVTGYSRAAAVSGLVGVHINESQREYNIDSDDLFVYSFESPRYSNNNKKYDNIHNVINKNDIITYFYPESWGLYHSGIDEEITTKKRIIKEKYLDIFSNDRIKDLDNEDIQRFLGKFINMLPKDRKKYDEISSSIISIYELFNSKSSAEKNKIIEFLKNISIDFDLDNSIKLLSLINSDDKKVIRNAYNSLLSNCDKEYYKIKNVLSEDEYNTLKDDIFNIYLFLQPSIKEEYKSSYKFSNILTFIYNVEEIFKEHYFDINLKQVQSKDSYYSENA